jgi:putative MATE family efflux protein
MFVGIGAGSCISIRLGRRDKLEAERVLGNAASLLLLISAILTILGLAFLDSLLRLFGASPTVLPFARDYAQIIVLGTVFQIVGFGLNATIRGEGNPRVAMLTLLIGVGLNVVLAPLFIFGCGWGMKGAASATVLSQAVSACWVLAYFLSGRSVLRFRFANMALRWPVCAVILAVGSPMFLMQLAASVMNSLMNNQLQYYGGDSAISIMGIIYSVVMMIAMPVFGINQGAQPVIGYNYGARQLGRVKRALGTAVVWATVIALFGFVVMMIFPASVTRLFHRGDEAFVALGTHAMRISACALPLVGFQVLGAGYFQAVGKPKQAMLLGLSRQVLLLIPAILVLPRFFGLNGIWAAMPVADLVSSLLTGVWLSFEWRHLREEGASP